MRKYTANILSALGLSTLAFACGEKDGSENNVDPAPAECQRDDHSEPSNAVSLSGEGLTGFVCPVGDLDWYAFEVPANETVVSVSLTMPVTISPIQPTYAIYPRGAEGNPDLAAATPPADVTGTKLSFVHCVAPGSYYMVVRDSGDNQADTRNQYAVSISTSADPDVSEPNNDRLSATTVTSGQTISGTIACRSDQDWYTVDVPEGRTIRVRLTSANAAYQPTLRMFGSDDTLIFEEKNQSNTAATAIDRYQVPPGPGKFYFVVSDDNNQDADPAVPYQLIIDLVNDEDPNEPNNTPEEAVRLSAGTVNCGADWSQTFTSTGTIGSPGDDDWFRIDLGGCSPGVVEAIVDFDPAGKTAAEQWEFNAEIQATVTIVKPHAPSPCDEDTDCNTLQETCSAPLDCAGLFETCLNQGLCAGASVCLPTGTCGANIMQRKYECNPRITECRPSATPPPRNQARAAATISNENVVFVRVNDFQANGSAPDSLYTLRVRVRADSDANEPNNLPLNITSPDYRISQLASNPSDITIRDCTAGDCCGTGANDVTGSIAYDGDTDWFRIPHPCPGTDCTLRMNWRTSAGPTDIAINIYREGGGSWNVARNPEQMESQPAASGTLGGTTAGNGCFYAFQGHDEGYLIEVRDRTALFSDDVTVRPDSHDWDPGQTYGFCIEKVSNVCSEPPCKVYPNGCGQP
jgi:hypothetical protein